MPFQLIKKYRIKERLHARPIGHLVSFINKELNEGCLQKIKISMGDSKADYSQNRSPDILELLKIYNEKNPNILTFYLTAKSKEVGKEILDGIEKIINTDYKKPKNVNKLEKYIFRAHTYEINKN